ncbi:MAG TPA: hypothetical protein VMV86_01365 [Methanosarcinales archaeon]|nr:hypothetical protein [Methanosarcinales archaeon]
MGKYNKKMINNIREAYTQLYYKSREIKVPKENQDEALSKLVDKLYSELYEKLKNNNEITSEEKSLEFLEDIKGMSIGWKKEIEEGKVKSKKRWLFW